MEVLPSSSLKCFRRFGVALLRGLRGFVVLKGITPGIDKVVGSYYGPQYIPQHRN